MIKSFYTSSLLFDVLSVFGELSDEVSHGHFVPYIVSWVGLYFDAKANMTRFCVEGT